MKRYLIVCPLIFLAGFVDSIAGGGALISFPAYMLAGVSAQMTIGTSKLSSFPGAIVAAARFARSGYIRWKLAAFCAVAAFCGAQIGAHITLRMSDQVIESLMLFVLPVVAFCVLRSGNTDEPKKGELAPKKLIWVCAVISAVIGTYNGFYGPGTGTFLILAFSNIAGLKTKEAAGLAKIANFSADISAVGTFLANDRIDYRLGLTAAIFCIAGSYIGSGLVVNNGRKIVRPVIIVVLALLFIKILTGR